AFDPDVDDVPPVQLVEREVDRIVDREQPEEGDAPHSEEQHGRDRRPPAFQYGGRYVVEKDQRHDHDSQLDPHGLLEEFAASVNSEQIADHRRQRAEHQQAELNVGQNRALDLALRLFGNEVVGGTEEAHQQPHDQRVGVDHSQDIEGKYLGQKVGKDVNDARQHTEDDLNGEKEESAEKIRISDPLRLVAHAGSPLQPASLGGQPWVSMVLVHSRK